MAFIPKWEEFFAFTENRKLKTENHKKKSPILSMELPLPSGVA
jgi:hypothetical protein